MKNELNYSNLYNFSLKNRYFFHFYMQRVTKQRKFVQIDRRLKTIAIFPRTTYETKEIISIF